MSIGKKLLALRQERGLSQEQLASQLHVSRQTVSKWESDLSLPDMKMMLSISEFYQVSITQLLGLDEKENQEGLIERIYEQTNVVLDNLQTESQKRKKRDVFIIGTCLISVCIICVLFLFILNKETPSISPVVYQQGDTVVEERLFDYENSVFETEYYDFDQNKVFLNYVIHLTQFSDDTKVKLSFTDTSNKEHIFETTKESKGVYTYRSSVPLLDYQTTKICVDQPDGSTKVQSLGEERYVTRYLKGLNVLDFYMPHGKNGRILRDRILYTPNFNSHSSDQSKENIGQIKGKVKMKIFDYSNGEKEVIDTLLFDLEKSSTQKLNRKYENNDFINFQIFITVNGEEFELEEHTQKILSSTMYSNGYRLYYPEYD